LRTKSDCIANVVAQRNWPLELQLYHVPMDVLLIESSVRSFNRFPFVLHLTLRVERVVQQLHLIFIVSRAKVCATTGKYNARSIDGEANRIRSEMSSVPSFAVVTFLKSNAS
jgi:hypothetical protein